MSTIQKIIVKTFAITAAFIVLFTVLNTIWNINISDYFYTLSPFISFYLAIRFTEDDADYEAPTDWLIDALD